MNNNCPICNETLVPGIQPWHFECATCHYEKGDLQPTINDLSSHELINEADRETGLREIRTSNFNTLIDVISKFKPTGGSLIDVGCAHGWFVESAMIKFDVLGVEPDEMVFKSTVAKGLPVRRGYFPDALEASETFDIVVFNDVIEHIPGIDNVLAACHDRLNECGLLVINLPSSDGFFYKLSRFFGRIGKLGFFERLWQKDLPSPHVHYFNSKNLSDLLKNKNFTVIKSGTLPTIGLKGLYTRISYTGKLGIITKIFIYCMIAIALPIMRLLPSDIIYIVARKN
ncbi:class I SAM-dependent methyltransferase [Pseudomonas baetica]|uniref:class I SAM-dependent methyltransferase n=1 Tax=Pseudomonas baetica TaxID=674054 RepID=UPI003EEF7C4D